MLYAGHARAEQLLDPLSQGILGAVAAQAVARPQDVRVATAVGFAAGCAADLDVLLPTGADPLQFLEHHRHFTHALAFAPVGALVVSLILAGFVRKRITWPRLYLYCLIGYATHGPLDALTTYGTHLFWPFSSDAVATGTIAIVDPIFTLVLLGLALMAWRRRVPRFAHVGLAWALMYFSAGFIQQARAKEAIRTLAIERGHTPSKMLVKTTMGNLVLWRSVYLHEDRFFVDAARVGMSVKIYPGASIQRFVRARELPGVLETSELAHDIARFDRFSQGYVARDPREPNVLGDVRYSGLPNGVEPLWGVRLPEDTSHRVEWVDRDEIPVAVRQQFIEMLLGR